MRKLATLFVAIMAIFSSVCKATVTDSVFTIQGLQGNVAVHLQLPSNYVKRKVPFTILCHGLIGNQNEPFISKIAKMPLKKALGVVRFDFNGHGQREGSFQDHTILPFLLLSCFPYLPVKGFLLSVPMSKTD